MVTLNADAVEFHPSQQYSPVPTQNYCIVHTAPFHYYYPTLQSTLPSYPTSLSCFHPYQQQQHYLEAAPDHEQQQKKEVVVVAEERKGGAKRNIPQKQVFNFISRGRMDRECSYRKMRLSASAWRRKRQVPAKEEPVAPLKNRQHKEEIIPELNNFGTCCNLHTHHKKRVFPVCPKGNETTVMIKNIPSKYNRHLLVQFLENHCKVENEKDEENSLAFDFVYLPIDFKSGMNKGYAFVNFTNPEGASKFLLTASGGKWDLFLSNKIRQVACARIQGKEELELHFKTMLFPSCSEAILPVCFSPPRDGVTNGSNHRTIGNLFNRRTHNHL